MVAESLDHGGRLLRVLLLMERLPVKAAAGWGPCPESLVEPIIEVEGSGVIVTWVEPDRSVDLFERGINESQAADLRYRLSTFAQDWDNL